MDRSPPPPSPPSPSPPSPRSRSRRRALRLGASAVALAVGLGLLEVALRLRALERVAGGRSADGWHAFDPRLGWRGAPGWRGEGAAGGERFTVRLNGRGLRMDREVPDRPTAGVPRVVFVGDSFPFGYGVPVEAATPARLESALSVARGGAPVEVVNLGTCAWGVGHFRLAVEDLALPLAPDLVLVSLIADDARRAQRAVSLYGQAQPRFVLDGDGAPRLVDVPVAPPPPPGSWRLGDGPPGGGSFLAWQLEALVERARVAREGEGARRRWRVALALLRDAARVARARGVPLAVVLFPWSGAADDDPVRAVVAGLEPEVPVVDLFPAFAAARAAGAAPFLAADPHPGPAGHAAAAEALARALVERRLVSGPP